MTFKRYKSGDRRISAGDMNARAGAIEGLLQSGGPGSFFDGAGHQVRRVVYDDGSGPPLITARITAFTTSGNYYTAVKMQPNGTGGYSDVSPEVSYNVFEVHGFAPGIEIGTRSRVWIQSAGVLTSAVGALATGTAIYSFSFVEPGEMFKVKLYKTGGAAGPPSTWTYTAKTPNDHVLGTGLTPELRRPTATATTFPSDGVAGFGYYDAAGAFHLFEMNESC